MVMGPTENPPVQASGYRVANPHQIITEAWTLQIDGCLLQMRTRNTARRMVRYDESLAYTEHVIRHHDHDEDMVMRRAVGVSDGLICREGMACSHVPERMLQKEPLHDRADPATCRVFKCLGRGSAKM